MFKAFHKDHHRFLLLFCAVCLYGCGGGGGGGSGGLDENCSELKSGPPIGLSCIHCMHPKAQDQAMILAQIAHDTCHGELAVNYLIDGTFGLDDDFLVRHISALAEGRNLTVILYFSNGAAQRVWQDSLDFGFGTKMSPQEFRSRINNDPAFQEAYKNIAQRGMAIKARVPSNVRFIFTPGLEDNLGDRDFAKILSLTREISGDTVTYGRNPSYQAYPGNDIGIPPGVLSEFHNQSLTASRHGNIATNDGITYSFPNEPLGVHQVPLSTLSNFKAQAQAENRIFILWTHSFQGVSDNGSEQAALRDPNLRDYLMPTDQQIGFLLDFFN